jgi:hypothetical protein
MKNGRKREELFEKAIGFGRTLITKVREVTGER